MANIVGTVTDINGDPVPNAEVVLQPRGQNDPITIVTPENGYFEFHSLQPGIPYKISVSAKDFADWTSPAITLEPGQFKIVTGIRLRIPAERTTVDVHYDPLEVATDQLKVEEHQRVFGIIPNFYVSYEQDPAPLTAGMKFQLALNGFQNKAKKSNSGRNGGFVVCCCVSQNAQACHQSSERAKTLSALHKPTKYRA